MTVDAMEVKRGEPGGAFPYVLVGAKNGGTFSILVRKGMDPALRRLSLESDDRKARLESELKKAGRAPLV